jgi:DNA topoisomerase-1
VGAVEPLLSVLDAFYVGFSKTLKQAEEHLEKVKVPEVESDEVCEQCGRRMVIKSGRYGKFLACPGYPECKNTKPIVETTEGLCPLCGSPVEAKKSRTNRKFYGCSRYPACKFATWNEPTKELCPKCGKTLFRKKEKNRALVCLTEGCGYEK